jgi:Fe-S cluster assembly protein SufD
MALPQVRADSTAARIAGLRLPEGAAWATEVRRAALGRLTAMGLPQRRDEYWRYTDPAGLLSPVPAPAALLEDNDPAVFAGVGAVRIVFIDGVFDAEASDPLTGTGIEIERLSVALSRDIHWARELYGVLEARGQQPVERAFAAMNTAFAGDGVVIRATGTVTPPVHLVYLHRSETSDAMLHHLIRVEAGAAMTLLESGPAAARFSKAMEVDVAEGAAFHHVRIQGRDHLRRAVTGTFARLGQESLFKSFSLTMNGVLTRNECVIEMAGDGASAHVAGAALGDGADFHHDDTVFVTHAAVGCESRQVFKKVLRNGAVGVFQGKILVRPGAQKTDGYQISQALLLDDDSQFLAKPELEIYADDVACSHGSTSGAIDETGLFYLRSRGVPEGEAKDLLVLAFLAEALAEIADDRLAEDLRSRLEGWLARRRK